MINRGEIKAVGFDLDECLYPSDNRINNLIRNFISESILSKLKMSNLEDARKLFEEKYAQFASGSKVLVSIGYNQEEADRITDRAATQSGILELIKSDPTTSRIVKEISEQYQKTFLITTSPLQVADDKLKRIGINPSYFNYRIYGDCLGYQIKQEGKSFQRIISETDFAPSEHVYIGNSRKADILPAKKEGMQTIAVWSQISEANLSIRHIHDLEGVLL